MSFCSSEITNFEFPIEEIEDVRKSNRLLSMEIEFSLRCNFKCPYCYVESGSDPENELSLGEIKDVINQARDLGARKIIILGGEPMIYPNTMEIIRYISEQGMEIELFTNGSRMTRDVAVELFTHGVRVVLKMNTFGEELQNRLSGTNNAHNIIHTALNNLKAAGYPGEFSKLAISTIMCKQNKDELVDLWIWLREQGILPYFEMITPQENAKENEWLDLDPGEAHELFKQLSKIDREKYGHVWDPQPPLVGNKCLRHQFSCLVTSKGEVLPCVGVTISAGNIRQKQLKSILRESIVIQNLRNYSETIKEPCGSCDKADHCYGCRGAAYQLTGDYLASDPLCWRNHRSVPENACSTDRNKPPSRLMDSDPKASVA